jgi:hypothetical protein
MPTHNEDPRFLTDWADLTPLQQAAFKVALRKFVDDLCRGSFRKGLRIERLEGTSDVWEMTWANDGRALFTYGSSVRPDDPHVVWLRVGGHDILKDPT